MKFPVVRHINNQIDDLVKNEENYEELTTPVCAFITFETDNGKDAALLFSKKRRFYESEDNDLVKETIFNETPVFKQATEPTNIIWENRHIKGINFGARVTGALLISIFMMCVAFFVIFAFKKA